MKDEEGKYGWVEVSRKDGHILTPKQQEDSGYVMCQCNGSDLREAKEEEYNECKNYYEEHGECKYHIVEDEVTGCGWYTRNCIICGHNIGLI